MVAFLTRMPSGIPGAITRESQAKIEPVVLDAAGPFPGYGLFGKVVSGKVRPMGAADVAASVYGLLVRPFPTNSSQDGLGTSTPPQNGGIGDMLVSGYASVKSNAGTPALNGTVYIRVANAAGGKPIGGIEAVADSTNTIVVAGARFMGPADASGNAEIAFNV